MVINMIYYEDNLYEFFELFNEENGTLVRSNVFGTDLNPSMRSFPELIDIGIMGKCTAAQSGLCKSAGIDCYQNAINVSRPNMSLEDYQTILHQSKNKVFQVALGGAGDPNKHEHFEKILKMTREHNIVPNLTTSGYQLTDDEICAIKTYCGAVAVSFYSRLFDNGDESNKITIDSIRRFVEAGCETNIHCVVSNDNLDEIIYRLENNLWPDGINAVIFVLYKPVGLGIDKKLVRRDERLQHFLNAAIMKKHPYKVGFDTCFTSALVTYDRFINISSIDACEAAKFSMYIDCELNAYPCSFDNQMGKYRESLRDKTIDEIWNGKKFTEFRTIEKERCNHCAHEYTCNKGCKLLCNIDLCASVE